MKITENRSPISIAWLTDGIIKSQSRIVSRWGDNKAVSDKYLVWSIKEVSRRNESNKNDLRR